MCVNGVNLENFCRQTNLLHFLSIKIKEIKQQKVIIHDITIFFLLKNKISL